MTGPLVRSRRQLLGVSGTIGMSHGDSVADRRSPLRGNSSDHLGIHGAGLDVESGQRSGSSRAGTCAQGWMNPLLWRSPPTLVRRRDGLRAWLLAARAKLVMWTG
jgi:hypothetical protein